MKYLNQNSLSILQNNTFKRLEIRRLTEACYLIIYDKREEGHILSTKDDKALTYRHKWQIIEYLTEQFNIAKEELTFI